MPDKKIIQRSALAAVATGAYISFVSWFMTSMGKFMGPDRNAWAPIVFLLLFVISAAVTGTLVLGKPVLLYLDGAKKEALKLFGFTVSWLAILFFLVLVVTVLVL